MSQTRVRTFALVGVFVTCLGIGGCRPAATPPPAGETPSQFSLDSVAIQIRSLVDSGRVAPLDRPGFAPYRVQLDQLYAPGGYAPLWVDRRGVPTAVARTAVRALLTAPTEGLDSIDYSTHRLERLADSLAVAGSPDPRSVGAFDLGLSVALLRYATDLHAGRVDPRTLGFKFDLPADRHDIPSVVRSAIAAGRLEETIEELRPTLSLYRRIQKVLVQYRALPPDTPDDILPAAPTSIRPGDHYIGMVRLYRRLTKLGDLPAGPAPPADSAPYTGEVVEAVKRFQGRHGLESDGVLGKGTLAALNIPIGHRIDQLAISLERLRWLPDLNTGRQIVVNIPTYRLWAWDSLGTGAKPTLEMNVIVGKSLDTQTPVFAEEMKYLILRPYWNVPTSILRKEMLPRLRKDPGYLERNDLEMVQGQGDDARPMAPTPGNIELLRNGRLRVRQRPGPRNSLGLVKFIFPNDEHVYLHSTPAQELFNRTRRDFSHGCVRVEQPVDLAEWALRDVGGWDRARIVAAMDRGSPLQVNLARPIPVLMFYTTAIVLQDGTPQFFEDVYGHDTRLLRTLHEARK
jgi:murein L,D-transpeptidase YcbB/YkuD